MEGTQTGRLTATFIVAALLTFAVSAAEAARCYTTITFYNTQRTVPGPVSVECGIGSEYMHSAPFGNWGVKSNHGGAYDGYQFAGWHPEDGWRQWNSCTSRYRGLVYLPRQPQIAQPGHAHVYATSRRRGRPGVPCSRIHRGGVYVLSGLYMRLYELDTRWDFILGGNGSDHVATLSYPTVVVPIRCTSSSYCHGRSAQKSQLFPRVATASIFVLITTHYR